MEKEEYLQFSWKYRVTVNDMDFQERIKPSSVMAIFQDIATEHANHLEIGYSTMTKKNLAWIMSRLSFKVFFQPKIGEVLIIKTFPKTPRNADVDRDYYIENEKGEVLIAGSSKWCVVDIKSRKVQRCAPLFEGKNYNFIKQGPYEGVNARVDVDFSKMSDIACEYSVQISDLDRNKHMNNSRYADLAYNSCGKMFLETRELIGFDINFVSELFYLDKCRVHKLVEGNCVFINAVKNDDKVVFRAKANFRD